eukprot:scaffold30617_cov18-Tisochrysis_lutea.AAC.5
MCAIAGTSADSSMHRSGPAIPESQSLHGRPYTDILPPHLRSPISRDGRSMSTIRPPELGAPTLDRNKRRGSLWRAFQPFRNIVRYSFTALAPLPAPLTLGDGELVDLCSSAERAQVSAAQAMLDDEDCFFVCSSDESLGPDSKQQIFRGEY